MPKPRSLRVAALLTLSLLAPVSAYSQTDPQPNGRVVLVLPFDNRSGETTLNWIGDSFPDTLNQRLSSSGFLTISHDDRQFALDHLGLPLDFRPTRATTLRIAQTLDANFVIVGNYTVRSGRIQVQAQILQVDKLKLSAPLEDSAELARLFDIENAIAWKVARQIDPHFSVAQQTFLAASTGVKLTSFENYIRGLDAPTPPERIKRLDAAVADSPTYAAALLALGKQQFADRNYDQAAVVLEKVPHSDRLALEAGFYLGMSHFNEAHYADAESAFAFVATRLPLPEVVNNQGVAASRQGKDSSAILQRAANADPTDADYHYNVAVATWRKGDFAAAKREIEASLKLKPKDAEALDLQAHIAAGRAPVANAKSNAGPFQPLERIRRTYSEASFRQAAFQLDQVRAMRIAMLPPSQQVAEYTQLGRDYLAQGLLPESEQEFQGALAADKSGTANAQASATAYAGLAQIRERSGSMDEARENAQNSLKLAPNTAAWLVLARLEVEANNIPAAVVNINNALRLDPKDPAVQAMSKSLQSHP